MTDVLSVNTWPTNAHLIADVAKLGYLDGTVFDATYGEGGFWTVWEPEMLITNDLYKPVQFQVDYRRLHIELGEKRYDAVVFDPDYKLTGTPSTPDMDYRYGTDKPKRWQDRLQDIIDGARSCAKLSAGTLLVKCMDQVVSGKMVWQTDAITEAAFLEGLRKVDRFDFVTSGRPQPKGRRQVHARHNASQLLVFKRR